MLKILLHQWEVSPFCRKVRKILQYKQLDYTVVNYNGLRALQVSRLSHAGKLPVLDYGSDRIQDSSDIAQFLERQHPNPPLYPANEMDYYHALLWEDWADESLYWYEVYLRFMNATALKTSLDCLMQGRPGWERWILNYAAPYLYKNQVKAQGLGRMEYSRVEQKFFEHLHRLEAILKQQPWLVGTEQSIADIAVSAQLEEVLRTSPAKEEILAYTAVADWLQKQQ